MILNADLKRLSGLVLPVELSGGDYNSATPVSPILRMYASFASLVMCPIVMILAFINFWAVMAFIAVVPPIVMMMLGVRSKLNPAALVFSALETLKRGGISGLVRIGFAVVLIFALFSYIHSQPPAMQSGIFGILTLIAVWMDRPKIADRSVQTKTLADTDARFQITHKLLDEYKTSIQRVKTEKIRQAKQALADPNPLINVGLVATGHFAQQGDMWAYDAGTEIVQTLLDASPGVLLVGEPGTGKTAVGMRNYAKGILTQTQAGCLILDNKNVLQLEMASMFDGVELIDPENSDTIFNPIEGLPASEAIEKIVDAFASDDEKDGFWNDSGKEFAFHKLLILETASKVCANNPKLFHATFYNVTNALILLGDDNRTLEILNAIIAASQETDSDGETTNIFERDDYLYRSYTYIINEMPEMPDDTIGGVRMTAKSWLSKLTLDKRLFGWFSATKPGVRMEDICAGKRYALAVPFVKYGVAGTVIEKIARYRLYDAVIQRPDSWASVPGQQPVAMFWDEMASGIGNGRRESVAMLQFRSKGFVMIAALQTITELESRWTEKRAKAFVALFKNIICHNSDPNSLKIISEQFKNILKFLPVEETKDIAIGLDYHSSLSACQSAAIENSLGTSIYDQELIENVSVSTGVSEQETAKTGNGMMLQVMQGRGILGGAGKTKTSTTSRKILPELEGIRFTNGGKMTCKSAPRFDAERDAHLLNVKFSAFVSIQRAGSMMYDYADGRPIFTSNIFAKTEAEPHQV
jgi:hypothetical protein